MQTLDCLAKRDYIMLGRNRNRFTATYFNNKSQKFTKKGVDSEYKDRRISFTQGDGLIPSIL